MTPSHETDAVSRRCTPTGVALPSQRTRGGNRNDVSTASCETRHSTAPRREADRATGHEPWASCPCSHRGRTSNHSMRWRASSRGLMSGHRGHAIRSKPMLRAAAPESPGVVTHVCALRRASATSHFGVLSRVAAPACAASVVTLSRFPRAVPRDGKRAATSRLLGCSFASRPKRNCKFLLMPEGK